MVVISSCLCASNLICGPKDHYKLSRSSSSEFFGIDYTERRNKSNQVHFHTVLRQHEVIYATKRLAKSSESDEKVPSWAQPDSDEPPPWARSEGKPVDLKDGVELPFFVYLLASAVTAIAAIGSIFEYANQKPVFGLLNSDSIFYTPVLGFFAFTGIPTSAFLWYKSVQAANKEAEEQDRRDGYR
ncbi:hypothetical protein RND81_03G136400 [Saponaria officinalis]|uniref:Uncharacterized protein n=1 Tax=Saponaria officinalis TaxID=3572 RepID=A0AAW1M8R6_SAPOF